MFDRTKWRVCSSNGWWRVFSKERGSTGTKPGPSVNDDLVQRHLTAEAPIIGADIAEDKTGGDKLHVCAINHVHSNGSWATPSATG